MSVELKSKRKWLKRILITIAVIVLVMVILAVFFPKPEGPEISALGTEQTSCKREFKPTFSKGPYYNDKLYDDHFHIPPYPENRQMFMKQPKMGEDITINEVMCTFEKENVKGALGFYMPYKKGEVKIPQAKEIKDFSGDKLNMFISPVYLSPKELEKILDENPGLFEGIGEMFYYQMTSLLRPIDGQWTKDILEIARKRDLPVMMHPGSNQQEKLEKLLTDYPDITFILHGHETQEKVFEMMEKYDNFYFSLDFAVIAPMRGEMIRGNEDSYTTELREKYDYLMYESLIMWDHVAKKYPDRLMWGTDKSTNFNYSEKMSVGLEEFSRAFLGNFDKETQEKIAYKNAERLFKTKNIETK